MPHTIHVVALVCARQVARCHPFGCHTLLAGNECKFSFNEAASSWNPEALTPVGSRVPQLRLTLQRAVLSGAQCRVTAVYSNGLKLPMDGLQHDQPTLSLHVIAGLVAVEPTPFDLSSGVAPASASLAAGVLTLTLDVPQLSAQQLRVIRESLAALLSGKLRDAASAGDELVRSAPPCCAPHAPPSPRLRCTCAAPALCLVPAHTRKTGHQTGRP